MILDLICFDMLTLTYTAQVEENVLHICFESHHIIEYISWNWIAKTACDSRFKMLCYADFNIHRSSRRKYVACYADFNIYRTSRQSVLLIGFLTHHIIEYICWNWIAKTNNNSCFKIICNANYNIYHSRRRKCVAYQF